MSGECAYQFWDKVASEHSPVVQFGPSPLCTVYLRFTPTNCWLASGLAVKDGGRVKAARDMQANKRFVFSFFEAKAR